MAKVKCRVCANELSGVCSIKKTGVKLNKSRTCEAFVYDPSKVKVHEEIPTVKFGYKEQQEAKRKRKEEFERVKREARAQTTYQPVAQMGTGDSAHPLTGDLSRFMTSADKNEE